MWSVELVTIVVASTLLAGSSAAAPTGVAVVDLVERAVFGGALTWFIARSGHRTKALIAAVATALAGSVWTGLVGLAALVVATSRMVGRSRRDDLVEGLIGAACVQVLLRTNPLGGFGLSALVTTVVTVVAVVSAYRHSVPRLKRQLRVGGLTVAGFLIVAIAGLSFSAFRASSNLDRGLAEARAGLEQARAGDQTAAGTSWASANLHLDRAHRSLSSPLGKLSWVVPVVSQHARLAVTASHSGARVTASAAHAATVAPFQTLRGSDGTFDIDRIESMIDPVAATVAATDSAISAIDARSSPWVVGRFGDRVDQQRTELADAARTARDALATLRVAPDLLGGDGPRRYLVLFANPAESRGLGGFIAAWALIETDDGHIELTRHGNIDDLNRAGDWHDRHITGEDDYRSRYTMLRPTRYLQNISASPDFPTVARVAAQLFPQVGGPELDGVLYVDPIALAAMLELTGPIDVDGVPVRLDSTNAAEFLMHDQYSLYVRRNEERKDRLSDVAEATFDALTSGELPTVGRITEVLGPMVGQRRLLFRPVDPGVRAPLQNMGLTGTFPSPDGSDLLSVRTSNASANKADWYLDQITRYRVRYDPATGSTTATATINFLNRAPTSGEPDYVLGNQDSRVDPTRGRPYGSNTVAFSIYSALRPTGVTIDGVDAGIQIEHELGFFVASQTVTVRAGEQVRIDLQLEGDLAPGQDYELVIDHQPSANDQLSVITVEGPGASVTEEVVTGAGTRRLSVPTSGPGRSGAARSGS